jgi:hypothetical protein
LQRRDEGGDRSGSRDDGDADIKWHTRTQFLAATKQRCADDVDATRAQVIERGSQHRR